MDILNLWNDDPEELLLDLGFGCDEPDLSGRIPARFINHQSRARGINLQVFLEAQKNRLDLENPDVSNRFRQLEVLQQVTTAFSSLMVVSSTPLKAPPGMDMSAEARDRRKRVGMLFRRASKKSLSQIHNNIQKPSMDSTACPTDLESVHPPLGPEDNTIILKRVKPGTQETVSLSPLAEEQGVGPDCDPQIHQGALRGPSTGEVVLQRKKSPRQARESFEMEEASKVHSFDESSITGSHVAGPDIVSGMMRVNSCQSDSSGFLEEPVIPSLPQEASPTPDFMKALLGLSGGSTDSHSPASSTLPHHTASSTVDPGVDNSLLSSSCLSVEPSCISPPPVSQDLTKPAKPDPHSSETDSKQDQDLISHPASLSESFSHHSISLEFQNITESRHPTPSSPACGTSVSPCFPLQPALMTAGSQDIHSEDCNTLSLVPSNPSHYSDSASTIVLQSISAATTSDSLSTNCDCPSSISLAEQSALKCWNQENKHPQVESERKVNIPLGANTALLGFNLPSATSPSIAESTLQNPEDTQTDSDSGCKRLSTPCSSVKMKDRVTPCSLSSNFHNPDPSSVFSDFPSSNSQISACKSTLLPPTNNPDVLTDPAVDLVMQSLFQPDIPSPHDNNTDASLVSPVQHVKMYGLCDSENQRHEKSADEDKRHNDSEQTPKSTGSSNTESFGSTSESLRLVCEEANHKSEPDPEVLSSGMHEKLSTSQEEFSRVFHMEIDGKDNEPHQSSHVSHGKTSEALSKTVKVSDLIEIESLDQMFETSVDGSEGEYGDIDAFFQEIDSVGHVYWAEPIQVSDSTPQSGSFEASDESSGNFAVCRCPVTQHASSSADKANMTLATKDMDEVLTKCTPSKFSLTTPEQKQSSCSVSIQMSSSPSSHIVHRRDVPYNNDPKHAPAPGHLPLDTSSPFRAVQSWTDLHIQRNTLTNKPSHGASCTNTKKVSVSTSTLETVQTPAVMFLSSPSLPVLSDDWQSHDCLPGIARNNPKLSLSVDTGLWPDDGLHEDGDEDVDKNDPDQKLWQSSQTATTACYCSCDHQCNRQHFLLNVPYSLDELEEMMLCLQQFRSVLSNMEEQLSEDQAAVYSALNDQDREKIQDIEELRRAVKQEAGELELQLTELAHRYDDSLKMKMHRLLDEQSLLCTQLRVLPPGIPAPSSPTDNRTVATQCCLLTWPLSSDHLRGHISSRGFWDADSPRQSPPRSASFCEGLGCSPAKADKRDIMGFLQRLKESLRHSVNTDTLE